MPGQAGPALLDSAAARHRHSLWCSVYCAMNRTHMQIRKRRRPARCLPRPTVLQARRRIALCHRHLPNRLSSQRTSSQSSLLLTAPHRPWQRWFRRVPTWQVPLMRLSPCRTRNLAPRAPMLARWSPVAGLEQSLTWTCALDSLPVSLCPFKTEHMPPWPSLHAEALPSTRMQASLRPPASVCAHLDMNCWLARLDTGHHGIARASVNP